MNHKDFVVKLQEVKACEKAIDYVVDNKYSLIEAWNNCERADWLLWLMCRLEFATQKERIHIICDCAATALKYIPKGEDRPRKAIKAARRYADNPTEENRNAAAATNAATAATAATAAAYAVANATNAAAYAAATAAYAAYTVANAAYTATNAAADKERQAHKKMCKMIRRKIKI